MRVAAAGLRVVEVPVGQRRRAGGVSKVSGDLRTAARVAWVLVATFLRLAVQMPARRPAHVSQSRLSASRQSAAGLPCNPARACPRRRGLCHTARTDQHRAK